MCRYASAKTKQTHLSAARGRGASVGRGSAEGHADSGGVRSEQDQQGRSDRLLRVRALPSHPRRSRGRSPLPLPLALSWFPDRAAPVWRDRAQTRGNPGKYDGRGNRDSAPPLLPSCLPALGSRHEEVGRRHEDDMPSSACPPCARFTPPRVRVCEAPSAPTPPPAARRPPRAQVRLVVCVEDEGARALAPLVRQPPAAGVFVCGSWPPSPRGERLAQPFLKLWPTGRS